MNFTPKKCVRKVALITSLVLGLSTGISAEPMGIVNPEQKIQEITEQKQQPQAFEGMATMIQMQDFIHSVAERMKESVVHIAVKSDKNGSRSSGLGSGLILDSEGTIVTNQHVVDQAVEVTVHLNDGRKFPAEVTREDQQTDLAILKIKDAKGATFRSAKLADSDKVEVGQWVLAVGNPYGFDRTVSFGIVSGKGRLILGAPTKVPLLNDFIQTDALIDPGSSGGPLINLYGQVVGINSVGIGRGQGFTIPANVVKEVMSRPAEEGQIRRGWLGAYLQPFTEEIAKHLGLPDQKGVLVGDIWPESPAAKAGLRSGDILTHFGEIALEAEEDEDITRVAQKITNHDPGNKVNIRFIRGKKQHKAKIVLGLQPKVNPTEVKTRLGMTVQEVTYGVRVERRLPSSEGVVITNVTSSSVADEGGLKDDDLITAIDNTPIKDIETFKKVLTKNKNKDTLLVRYRRGQITQYTLLETSLFNEKKEEL